jgi:uncharacterized protein YbaR (Trm112 family)
MKRRLYEILCCPTCKGDLELRSTEAFDDQQEIMCGVLICHACAVHYPIVDGIPNLLPQK